MNSELKSGMMKIKGIAKMDEERISQRVLYVIVALSAIVFWHSISLAMTPLLQATQHSMHLCLPTFCLGLCGDCLLSQLQPLSLP